MAKWVLIIKSIKPEEIKISHQCPFSIQTLENNALTGYTKLNTIHAGPSGQSQPEFSKFDMT